MKKYIVYYCSNAYGERYYIQWTLNGEYSRQKYPSFYAYHKINNKKKLYEYRYEKNGYSHRTNGPAIIKKQNGIVDKFYVYEGDYFLNLNELQQFLMKKAAE